jgi:ABC-type branched-subunit amino acid transport system ATPase component
MTALESFRRGNPIAEDSGLVTRKLSVSYGGVLAVNQLSLSAPEQRITGLIGPNGAGKTTTFNACNGVLRPSSGTVHLFGADVTRLPTGSRARMGLGRTFQRVEIVSNISVVANVSLGLEARLVGQNPLKQLFSSRQQTRRIADAANEALLECGIAEIAQKRAATLSTGQRRLLELARVLAGGYRILLLDEPSSGLDEEETERFGEVLKRVVAEKRLGILLVEHDMALVMDVCDYIYVMDFGCLVFEGTSAEAQTSDIVKDAYLGRDVDQPTP